MSRIRKLFFIVIGGSALTAAVSMTANALTVGPADVAPASGRSALCLAIDGSPVGSYCLPHISLSGSR